MTTAGSAATRFLTALRDDSDVAGQSKAGERLCAAVVLALPVGQAALTVSMPGDRWEVMGASGPIAARLADAQAAVGEGPGPDALDTGVPVRVRELAEPMSAGRWPMLAQWNSAVVTGSVCSFPLQLGAIQVGFLDLHDADAVVSTRSVYLDAVQVADVITTLLLSTLTSSRDAVDVDDFLEGPWWDQPNSAREIHQATGMVAVQLDCSAGAAYSRLVGHAFSSGHTLSEVAGEVVARRLIFKADPGANGSPDRDPLR